MVDPGKRSARFLGQGREAGAEPRATSVSCEHGEHLPLELGFLVVLRFESTRGMSPIATFFAFGEF